MTFQAARTHFYETTFDVLFESSRYFSMVVATLSLTQAVRYFGVSGGAGYDWLNAHHLPFGVMALMQLTHFCCAIARVYLMKFFKGQRWFRNMGRVGYVCGSFAFFALGVGLTFGSPGGPMTLGIGALWLGLAIGWQLAKMDL